MTSALVTRGSVRGTYTVTYRQSSLSSPGGSHILAPLTREKGKGTVGPLYKDQFSLFLLSGKNESLHHEKCLTGLASAES